MYANIFLTFASLAFSFVQADVYESTHLVTMRKAEFMEIIDCVSKSMNLVLCRKFEECQKFLPQQIVMATKKCKKDCMVGGIKKCSYHEPLFESPEVPHKIFDCVIENTHKLNAEESKMMVEYEKCIRDFHVKNCKFPKHHEEFHVEHLDGFH